MTNSEISKLVSELSGKIALAEKRHKTLSSGLDSILKKSGEHLTAIEDLAEDILEERTDSDGNILQAREKLLNFLTKQRNKQGRTLEQISDDLEKATEHLSEESETLQLLHDKRTEIKKELKEIQKNLIDTKESIQSLLVEVKRSPFFNKKNGNLVSNYYSVALKQFGRQQKGADTTLGRILKGFDAFKAGGLKGLGSSILGDIQNSLKKSDNGLLSLSGQLLTAFRINRQNKQISKEQEDEVSKRFSEASEARYSEKINELVTKLAKEKTSAVLETATSDKDRQDILSKFIKDNLDDLKKEIDVEKVKEEIREEIRKEVADEQRQQTATRLVNANNGGWIAGNTLEKMEDVSISIERYSNAIGRNADSLFDFLGGASEQLEKIALFGSKEKREENEETIQLYSEELTRLDSTIDSQTKSVREAAVEVSKLNVEFNELIKLVEKLHGTYAKILKSDDVDDEIKTIIENKDKTATDEAEKQAREARKKAISDYQKEFSGELTNLEIQRSALEDDAYKKFNQSEEKTHFYQDNETRENVKTARTESVSEIFTAFKDALEDAIDKVQNGANIKDVLDRIEGWTELSDSIKTLITKYIDDKNDQDERQEIRRIIDSYKKDPSNVRDEDKQKLIQIGKSDSKFKQFNFSKNSDFEQFIDILNNEERYSAQSLNKNEKNLNDAFSQIEKSLESFILSNRQVELAKTGNFEKVFQEKIEQFFQDWLREKAKKIVEEQLNKQAEENLKNKGLEKPEGYDDEDDDEDYASRHFRRRPFAIGGIVSKPTNALVGEAGPEAIIPIKKSSLSEFFGGITNIFSNKQTSTEFEAQQATQESVQSLPEKLETIINLIKDKFKEKTEKKKSGLMKWLLLLFPFLKKLMKPFEYLLDIRNSIIRLTAKLGMWLGKKTWDIALKPLTGLLGKQFGKLFGVIGKTKIGSAILGGFKALAGSKVGKFLGGVGKHLGNVGKFALSSIAESYGIKFGAKAAKAASVAGTAASKVAGVAELAATGAAPVAAAGTVAGKAASKGGKLSSLLKIGGKAAGGAMKFAKALGPLGLAVSTGFDAINGFNDEELHRKMFNLKEGEEASTMQKLGAGAASIASGLTFGIVSPETIGKLGGKISNMLFGSFDEVGKSFSDGKYITGTLKLLDKVNPINIIGNILGSAWDQIKMEFPDFAKWIDEHNPLKWIGEKFKALGEWFDNIDIIGSIRSFLPSWLGGLSDEEQLERRNKEIKKATDDELKKIAAQETGSQGWFESDEAYEKRVNERLQKLNVEREKLLTQTEEDVAKEKLEREQARKEKEIADSIRTQAVKNVGPMEEDEDYSDYESRIQTEIERLKKESPKMAEGGVVTKETLATIGEAGPEAIVPLSNISESEKIISILKEINENIKRIVPTGDYERVFEGISNTFNKAFSVMRSRKSFLSGLFEGFGNSNSSVFQKLKDAFASLFGSPKMAKGGIIQSETQVTAGESGPEAIIPLKELFKREDRREFEHSVQELEESRKMDSRFAPLTEMSTKALDFFKDTTKILDDLKEKIEKAINNEQGEGNGVGGIPSSPSSSPSGNAGGYGVGNTGPGAGSGSGGAFPVAGGGGDHLGVLSSKFESGGNSSAIGWDKRGGTSYGRFQIAAKTGTFGSFLQFCEKEGGQYGQEVASRLRAGGEAEGGKIGETGSKNGKTPEIWKQLASEGKIQDLEYRFIKKTHYDVSYKKLRPELKEMVDANPVLQEVLWSNAVQGPGFVSNFNDAYRPGITPQELVSAVYDKRATQFKNQNAQVQASAKNRMANEKNIALGWLGNGDAYTQARAKYNGNFGANGQISNQAISGNGGPITQTPAQGAAGAAAVPGVPTPAQGQPSIQPAGPGAGNLLLSKAREVLAGSSRQYVLGSKGTNGAYDCTGFVHAAMKKVPLPKQLMSELANTVANGWGGVLEKWGFQKIPYNKRDTSNLQPGDILWKSGAGHGHVEMYAGNSNVIGAHNSKKGISEQAAVNGSNFEFAYRMPASLANGMVAQGDMQSEKQKPNPIMPEGLPQPAQNQGNMQQIPGANNGQPSMSSQLNEAGATPPPSASPSAAAPAIQDTAQARMDNRASAYYEQGNAPTGNVTVNNNSSSTNSGLGKLGSMIAGMLDPMGWAVLQGSTVK